MIHDVLVLGGGPAGSAAAIRLAEYGHSVGLIERSGFPRSHVGICLADQTQHLLDYLGVGPSFKQAQFWRRYKTRVHWGGEQRDADHTGYHVDRGRLDHILIERAVGSGVSLYQPADVVRTLDEEGLWSVLLADGRQMTAKFLIDAGGRRPALPEQRIKDAPPLLALHAMWRFDRKPDVDGLIKASDDSWLWFARVSKCAGMLTVFLDPRAATFKAKENLPAWYKAELGRFSATFDLWEQTSDVQACDAGSSHARISASHRMIRVGDAAMAIDPLASQGVHLALVSSVQAAIAVNTMLSLPENSASAIEFYNERVKDRVARFKSHTAREYLREAELRGTSFWRSRANGAVKMPPSVRAPAQQNAAVRLSDDIQIRSEPVIEGDLIFDRDVVCHPNLSSPVKFLGEADLPELIKYVPPHSTIAALSAHFASQNLKGQEIVNWMWSNGLLELSASDPCSEAKTRGNVSVDASASTLS
jgi:flavin-dependent dehydrogenase